MPLQVLKDIQSIVVGEIMVDELQSFDTALGTGLGLGKTPRSKLSSQIDYGRPTKSASAGCAGDLPRLEKELRIVLDRCPPPPRQDLVTYTEKPFHRHSRQQDHQMCVKRK